MDGRRKERYLARATDIAMTIAGLTLVLTPLALWAAPTIAAFKAALITCAAAYGLFLLLSQIGPEDTTPDSR